MFTFQPLGYIDSVFKTKNGTPRQSGVVSQARAVLNIGKNVFTNPEHSVEGLQAFSHVWIIFVFHENNNAYTKAKVKPPRLNGKKVGLFSTRCPYRPNPIGLSLVKLDSVHGCTLHLSGVDLLHGTPVLDVKPYIPQYDTPTVTGQGHLTDSTVSTDEMGDVSYEDNVSETVINDNGEENDTFCDNEQNTKGIDDVNTKTATVLNTENPAECQDEKLNPVAYKDCDTDDTSSSISAQAELVGDKSLILGETYDLEDGRMLIQDGQDTVKLIMKPGYIPHIPQCTPQQTGSDGESGIMGSDLASVSVAGWVNKPPVDKLKVRFTTAAEAQLGQFRNTQSPDVVKERLKDASSDSANNVTESPNTTFLTSDNRHAHLSTCDLGNSLEQPSWSLRYLRSSVELRDAIVSILENDPRSTYRRKKCRHKLYYVSVDAAHVTAWFCEDMQSVYVLKVKHV